MHVPYDENTLLEALKELNDNEKLIKKLTEKSVINKLEKKLENYNLKNKSELNKKIAEYNGIILSELMSSPNYEKLRDEYLFNFFSDLTKVLKTNANLTDVQAWAIILLGSGTISLVKTKKR